MLLHQLLDGSQDGENNYVRIVESIGTVEVRMQRVTSIFESFDPIWPKYSEWTTGLMQRIALTLLPEMFQNEVIAQFITSLIG